MLVLVVGASGSGKDTLIAGARAALAPNARIGFPRREITRPAAAGGEDHIAVSRDEFAERQTAGHYALAWSAHGYSYGVPRTFEAELRAASLVIVNVSRTVIDEARLRYGPIRVIEVRVTDDVLTERLQSRGRESQDEIALRLARASDYTVSGPDVIPFCNDTPPSDSIARFVTVLEALMPWSGYRDKISKALPAPSCRQSAS